MSLLEKLGKTTATKDITKIEIEKVYKIEINEKHEKLKEKVKNAIIDEYNTNNSEINAETSEVKSMIKRLLLLQGESISRFEESKLVQEIYDDVMGLGPLEPLLRDSKVSEIMVNAADEIYVEKSGKLMLTSAKFKDDDHVLNVINRIVSPLGRRCDESSPMVDARLADGSRVNAIIPPIALKGPSLTIRKFSSTPLEIGDLIGFGTLSHKMANFLEACVKGRCNIIVAGGTGSGKTTLLNVLSGYIFDGERIVTIEDAAELQLSQSHIVTLEARPANVEGKGAIAIRDLVCNALRMRPDRIVVGECRSGETLDMLQAMNTGHDGSLTTVHANSPRDVVARLETMVMMSGMQLPEKAIREQIVSAIDIIVQQSRLRDGSRKIVNISEIIGMEEGTVTMQDIFTFKSKGFGSDGRISGEFLPTGIRPRAVDKIKGNGVSFNDDWFMK